MLHPGRSPEHQTKERQQRQDNKASHAANLNKKAGGYVTAQHEKRRRGYPHPGREQEPLGGVSGRRLSPEHQRIFSLKRFAFQTIRPVVSRKKRGFSAHFGPGGAVSPPRVLPFSKVKRSGDQKKAKQRSPALHRPPDLTVTGRCFANMDHACRAQYGKGRQNLRQRGNAGEGMTSLCRFLGKFRVAKGAAPVKAGPFWLFIPFQGYESGIIPSSGL